MLKIESLNKVFNGNVKAVNNLNLAIDKGESYTLLGANGAGKTTTINLIFNFLSPTTGSITIDGINANQKPLEAKKKLAFVSENVMLYNNFTAIQNLDYFSKLANKLELNNDDYKQILEDVGLSKEAFNKKLKTFSKGMRQKCGIAIAIAKDADYIILDEPTSGLDPLSGLEFIKLLKKLKENGKTIFMTTHDIFRAREVSDRIGIMRKGSLVKELSSQELEKGNIMDIYVEYNK